MFQYKPLDIKDFSGGMTDEYVNGPANRGEIVSNFRVLNNDSIITRYGSWVDSETDPQIPVGTQRIHTLINYKNDDVLFVHSGKRLYYRDPVNYSTVTSTVNSDLFNTATAQTHLGHTQWNGHLIITPETFDKPIKIYKDDMGAVQARTAGLPDLSSSPVIAQTFGFSSGNVSNIDAATDLFDRVAHGFITGLRVRFTNIGGNTPEEIYANTDYYVIVVNADQFRIALTLQNALDGVYIDITADETGIWNVFPQTGDAAYVYAFFYSYEYKVGDQTFIDFGPRTLVQNTTLYPPDIINVSLQSIPALVNGAGDHYDTANVKIQIYRTISGGQEFYKVTELANGTATYIDNLSDTLLQDNETIYTSGGVPDNDPPPLAKYCHTINNITYYAHIKDGAEIFPSVIRQAQSLDPDSVPESFNDELEDEITGISSVQDIPIVGCKKHIYRIDGEFDELGRGGMSHRRISDHAGCLSHESFVQAEGGLFWFGEDGIYYTEGFKCQKVTDHLNDRYKTFKETLADKTRKIKGVYFSEDRTIHWTISKTVKAIGSEECDALWVLDLTKGVSTEMPSHIWEGITFNPTSIVVFNKKIVRAEKTGYVLSFDEAYATDPKIIAGQPVNSWFQETIMWNFRSVTTDFGSGFTRKIANKLLLDMLSDTTLSVAITAINDEGRVRREFTPIRWRKGFVWGDEDFVWGDPNFAWYYGGIISVDRRFPARGLRFNYLQLDFKNAFINIVNSDLLGIGTVDGATNTITLVNVTNSWPAQAVDYYIYLEQDNYTKGYKVLGRTASALTLEDTLDTLVNSNQRWQLRGYKKGEVFNLVGYSLSWANISRSFDTFNQGDSGGLA